MAKWGRKSWGFRLFGGNRLQLGSGRSFRKVKTVSWGSRSSAGPSSPSPKKWGSGLNAKGLNWGSRSSSSSGIRKWGISRLAMSLGSRPRSAASSGVWKSRPRGNNSAGTTGAWGTRPTKPRIRRRTILLIVLVIMMLFSVQSFIYVERNLRPPLMNVAKIRVKQLATQAINKAITEQVSRQTESDKLIDWKMNSNGKISGFMLNYAEHMRITSQTINTVQSTLDEMKSIPEHIPIGLALNSAIISSFGPKVPVKFEPVGAAKVGLSTREKDAGINMILVEVYIRIIAEVAIIIPFDTEPEIIETDIPISYLLVVGDVPMYYYDNTGKPVGESAAQAPNISVPLNPGDGNGISSQPEQDKAASANAGSSNEANIEDADESKTHKGSGATGNNSGGSTD